MEAQPPRGTTSPMQTSEVHRQPTLPQYEMLRPHAPSAVHLPDLKTVLSPEYQPSSPPTGNNPIAAGSPHSSRSLPQIHTRRPSNGARKSMDAAIASPSESDSFMGSDDHGPRTRSGVSLEDNDVRDVAEALVGLGAVRSPPIQLSSHEMPSASAPRDASRQDAEPLLQLLTQAHPVPGAIINGSMNAYSGAKSFAPRFVQAGIDVAERNIGTPMVSAVGSMGRMTGVERAARWYLTPREQEDSEQHDRPSGRSKRRRVMDEEMDVESGIGSPRTSRRRGDSADSKAESLPSYRASRPPSYREESSPATGERYGQPEQRPQHTRTWSNQLILSASGLSVAMSDRSRRSLVYCLQLLGRSADHIATVSDALKLVLEQYDQARDHWHQKNDASSVVEKGELRPRTPEHDDSARRLAGIIQKHSDDIWQTLKGVVHSVSNTAGGALPANAREFVRRQLMSLPQRWQTVSDDQNGESETSRGAHRMVAFATEGLDMIGQVSQMCKATLDSAEGWVGMVGRRQQGAGTGAGAENKVGPDGYYDRDYTMREAQYAEKR